MLLLQNLFVVKKCVIIVAGGKGQRMSSDIPKQFMLVAGKPILMHTIEVFYAYDNAIQLIVALPPDQQSYWQSLCQKQMFNLPHTIVNGGETRFHSVKNALEKVDENCLIAIHDGVRPLVSIDTITRCFDAAEQKGAVIPVIEVVESIRQIDEKGNRHVNRNDYRLVQTPQVFKSSLIKTAFKQEYNDTFTDDASVAEAICEKVFLVAGNKENIKITTPFDLQLAEVLLKEKK